MKTLRAAVIGLGRIGWMLHIPQILKHDGFTLEAVVDPVRDRLEEARREFGVARLHENCETLFAAGGIDLAVIASPTRFHAPQALAAFAAGVDVFCDKPVALNLDECDAMIAAATAAGRRFMVYQPHRVTPVRLAAGRILERGLLGELYMAKVAMSGFVRRNDWQAWRRNGGGMLYNYGAHAVDQMLDLIRSTTRHADCHLRSVATLGDADDTVKIVLEAESGVIVDIDICMGAALPLPGYTLLGNRGAAAFSPADNAWKISYFEKDALPAKGLADSFAANGRAYPSDTDIPWKEEMVPLADPAGGNTNPDALFYQKVYEHFAEGKPPFVPLAETREVMRTLEICLASAQQKRR